MKRETYCLCILCFTLFSWIKTKSMVQWPYHVLFDMDMIKNIPFYGHCYQNDRTSIPCQYQLYDWNLAYIFSICLWLGIGIKYISIQSYSMTIKGIVLFGYFLLFYGLITSFSTFLLSCFLLISGFFSSIWLFYHNLLMIDSIMLMYSHSLTWFNQRNISIFHYFYTLQQQHRLIWLRCCGCFSISLFLYTCSIVFHIQSFIHHQSLSMQWIVWIHWILTILLLCLSYAFTLGHGVLLPNLLSFLIYSIIYPLFIQQYPWYYQFYLHSSLLIHVIYTYCCWENHLLYRVINYCILLIKASHRKLTWIQYLSCFGCYYGIKHYYFQLNKRYDMKEDDISLKKSKQMKNISLLSTTSHQTTNISTPIPLSSTNNTLDPLIFDLEINKIDANNNSINNENNMNIEMINKTNNNSLPRNYQSNNNNNHTNHINIANNINNNENLNPASHPNTMNTINPSIGTVNNINNINNNTVNNNNMINIPVLSTLLYPKEDLINSNPQELLQLLPSSTTSTSNLTSNNNLHNHHNNNNHHNTLSTSNTTNNSTIHSTIHSSVNNKHKLSWLHICLPWLLLFSYVAYLPLLNSNWGNYQPHYHHHNSQNNLPNNTQNNPKSHYNQPYLNIEEMIVLIILWLFAWIVYWISIFHSKYLSSQYQLILTRTILNDNYHQYYSINDSYVSHHRNSQGNYHNNNNLNQQSTDYSQPYFSSNYQTNDENDENEEDNYQDDDCVNDDEEEEEPWTDHSLVFDEHDDQTSHISSVL